MAAGPHTPSRSGSGVYVVLHDLRHGSVDDLLDARELSEVAVSHSHNSASTASAAAAAAAATAAAPHAPLSAARTRLRRLVRAARSVTFISVNLGLAAVVGFLYILVPLDTGGGGSDRVDFVRFSLSQGVVCVLSGANQLLVIALSTPLHLIGVGRWWLTLIVVAYLGCYVALQFVVKAMDATDSVNQSYVPIWLGVFFGLVLAAAFALADHWQQAARRPGPEFYARLQAEPENPYAGDDADYDLVMVFPPRNAEGRAVHTNVHHLVAGCSFRAQLAWAIAYMLVKGAMVQLCQTMAQYVMDLEGDSFVVSLGAFVGFILAMHVLRGVLKSVGDELDRRKLGSISFYFHAEYVSACYYFLFYRFLFTSLEDVRVFAGLMAWHVASEWLSYPLRCTEFWVTRLNAFFDEFQVHVFVRSVVSCGPLRFARDAQKTACFVCLDFGLRTALMLAVSLSYMVVLWLMESGYNARHFKSLGDANTHLHETLTFIGVSVVIEAINTSVMTWQFWSKRSLSMLRRVDLLFRNPGFYLYSITVFAAVLDVSFVSRLKYSSIS